jgi:hypothetical protein
MRQEVLDQLNNQMALLEIEPATFGVRSIMPRPAALPPAVMLQARDLSVLCCRSYFLRIEAM